MTKTRRKTNQLPCDEKSACYLLNCRMGGAKPTFSLRFPYATSMGVESRGDASCLLPHVLGLNLGLLRGLPFAGLGIRRCSQFWCWVILSSGSELPPLFIGETSAPGHHSGIVQTPSSWVCSVDVHRTFLHCSRINIVLGGR